MRFVEADALRRHGQLRDDDGLTLRVEGPVMRLQGPNEDRLLITEPVLGARFYKAHIEGITEARMAGRGWEWEGGYTLRPHLSCNYRPRDWSWAWTPTYGPVMLNIYGGPEVQLVSNTFKGMRQMRNHLLASQG